MSYLLSIFRRKPIRVTKLQTGLIVKEYKDGFITLGL